MKRLFLPILILLAGCAQQPETEPASNAGDRATRRIEPFVFEVDGLKLDGLLQMPTERQPLSTLIIVHGYGETNVVEQGWYGDLRARFARIGINTLVWDKPGCGSSEGEFDIDQPVESSAREVVAAVQALRDRRIEGSETIGLWGISRAGWIAPLAMQQDDSIAFWVSVSGTDDQENARYLIESNLRIEGRSESEVEQLVGEWQASFDTLWQDGTYEQYLNAAPNLSRDPFMELMGWGGRASEAQFLADQESFRTGALAVDEQTGLMIYVPGFRELLASIDKPVLALFGEKDTNVDWRKTAELYRETLGANPDASLTIRTFPDANHTLRVCETGGVREMLAQIGSAPYADGYYESMLSWLVEHGFGAGS